MTATYNLHHGDSLDVLRALPDNSATACVTDPPYGLRFMGKKWDYDVPSVELWEQVLRVLVPGGVLLSFSGSRTYHRMVVAIEDAGFEIRDQIMWLYGCLSDDTEILVDGRWEPYHKATKGRHALCFDLERNEYSWRPIENLFVYDYADTAFRIQSDRTDQIVSRNHRCIVERGGRVQFAYAEALEREEAVPVLEGLPELLRDLPLPQSHTGASESALLGELRAAEASEEDAAGAAQGRVRGVCGVRQGDVEAECVAEAPQGADVFAAVQRDASGRGVGEARAQGARRMDRSERGVVSPEDERPEQSGVEGRCDILPQARELQADQIRPVPGGIPTDGAQGWLRHGASADRREGAGAVPEAVGSCASCEPRSTGQPAGEFGAIREQPGPQVVRGTRYTASSLASVTPIRYVGKVWCVKVPTGAFVARRNGKVFVTGNSGFPKSLDISKAIDKAAGAEREKIGPKVYGEGHVQRNGESVSGYSGGLTSEGQGVRCCTAPATPLAALWHGYGTALKPAFEPICCAMKPLAGTYAANAEKWGVAGLNIEAGRVGTETLAGQFAGQSRVGTFERREMFTPERSGRWPANVIHDGSDEVLAEFDKAGPRHSAGNLVSNNRNGGIFSPSAGAGGSSGPSYSGTGSAARFFYCAKASPSEREAGLREAIVNEDCPPGSAGANSPRAGAGRSVARRNFHPTVKPIALMRYLCKLVRMPERTVILDPFLGSGTTGIAATLEGCEFVGIEREAEYVELARARIEGATQEGQTIPPTDSGGQLDLFAELLK